MSWKRGIIGQASLMQVNNNSFGMLFSFVGGEGGIEIQVDEAARLFHTLAPFPFRERDLAKDAKEFIIGWAREIPKESAYHDCRVHLPKAEVQTKAAACSAMRFITILRTVQRMRDLRELFRIGRYDRNCRAVCLCRRRRLALAALSDTDFARVLQEGLMILGWVANWRPIEIFLYEWLPMTRMRRLCRRLPKAGSPR